MNTDVNFDKPKYFPNKSPNTIYGKQYQYIIHISLYPLKPIGVQRWDISSPNPEKFLCSDKSSAR